MVIPRTIMPLKPSSRRVRSASSGFLRGIAKNLDISGSHSDATAYIEFIRKWSEAADAMMIYDDWQLVGADINKALLLYAEEREASRSEAH